MNLLPRNLSSRRAAAILRTVFAPVDAGFAFRLWDGTLVPVGHGAPVCTAVVRKAETFVRLMRDPTPLNFAEAYVEGALDIEGDLFAAIKVADAMEGIRLSWRDRLRLFVALWRA
jgi:cyclopropane-fatty-acyl-phospholipid synthase